MSRRLLRVLVLALALHVSAVHADDVYIWTDSSGETHYTNDIDSIPEKAKRTIRKLEGTTSSSSSQSAIPGVEVEKPKLGENQPTPTPTAEAKKPDVPEQPPPPQPIEEAIRPPRDDEKVNEEQWRTLFRKSNERVRRAERKVQRTREAIARLPGNDLTSYDYAGNIVVDSRSQSLKVQLEEDEYQLNAARDELHDLERAAAREAVPLEWRR
jgi:hypothetical protein